MKRTARTTKRERKAAAHAEWQPLARPEMHVVRTPDGRRMLFITDEATGFERLVDPDTDPTLAALVARLELEPADSPS